MAIRIYSDFMVLAVDGREVATARWSKDSTADRAGAWTVSWCTNRLLDRNEAITALTIAELRADGRGDDDPAVAALLEELHW